MTSGNSTKVRWAELWSLTSSFFMMLRSGADGRQIVLLTKHSGKMLQLNASRRDDDVA